MRLLVFFDLPVITKAERADASRFRKFLIDDGYYMIQYSLYGRLCNTIENVAMHEKRLMMHLPRYGSIRSMAVTEKQYSNMKILLGKPKKKDNHIIDNQISFF